MPAIPRVPGVPALTSYLTDLPSLLLRDLVPLIVGGLGGPQWGVFFFGVPIIPADTYVTFDFRQDWSVADYQIERGSFQSYDKVQHPADIRVRVACGGSTLKRQAFLTAIDLVMNTLNIYDVVTPEKVFLGYNFSHYDFKRSASDVGLLVVDIWLTQIRETAQATFTQTQSPTSEGQQSLGSVQAQNPLQRITQSFSSGSWRLF